MATILLISFFAISLLPLVLALQSTKGRYTTIIVYETVYPVETVYVTDKSQCSSLGLPMCNNLTWASGSLTAPATTAALLLSDDWVTTTLTSLQNSTTTTTTITHDGAVDEFDTLGSTSLGTKLNAVNTKNRLPTSSDLDIDIDTVSSTPSIASISALDNLTTATEDAGGETQIGSSSSSSAIVIPSSSNSVTTTTQNHRSPFLLERTGSTHYVQYGPEGSVIIGPVIPDRARAVPPMFILHHHGYLASGNDPDDIIFLRLASQNQPRDGINSSNQYYKVIHGPKANISFDDLTSRFGLKEGVLGFFEQGHNGTPFDWYAAVDADSISRLFMAPTQVAIPEMFSLVELSKHDMNKSLSQSIQTSIATAVISNNSTNAAISIPTSASAITTPQALATTTPSSSPDVAGSPDDESSSKTLELSSETSLSTFRRRPPARPTKCPKTPNPTRVWQLVKSIARLDLESYCSDLLGYGTPVTIIKTKAGLTRTSIINVTDIDETETEISTYYTETVTIAFSTVYDAGDEPEERKRQEEITSEVTYPFIDKSSYDGVYGTGDDISTQVTTVSEIDVASNAIGKKPAQLDSFCEIDIIEACSQAVPAPDPTTITRTKKMKTTVLPLTDSLTETKTKVILAASTTTLPNTTQISYPGTGRIIADSGTYRSWYVYWTGDAFDPGLYLTWLSDNATFFAAEYRPNMDTYRVYANAPGGERYYMSMSVPVGIAPITDYSIGLRTLNDINSDEGSVLLYMDLNWESGFLNVNMNFTGTERNTLFGCPMVVDGIELRAQVRLYAIGDGTVPRGCQAWSNLVLVS
ncbi:hypothetical protein TWF281_006763 [Arthrobotrys megalospora]